MTTREYIKNEIDVLPVSTLDTVQAFITFLLYRHSAANSSRVTAFKKQMQTAQKLTATAGLTKLDIKKSIQAVRRKNKK